MKDRVFRYSLVTLSIFIGLVSLGYTQNTETTFDIVQETKLENVSDFSLSNDNEKLLISKTNGDLSIWNIDMGESILTITPNTDDATLNSISWSADDEFIAGAYSDKARIWSSQTGELVYEINGHPRQPIFEGTDDGVHDIVFSPTEPIFATYAMLDTTILLFNSQTQEVIHELSDNVPESYVMEIGFSPDGSHLAVRQLSGQITVWDTQTGEKLHQFPGEAMEFSPDSTMLATGIGRLTSSIWIWDLSDGEQVSEITTPLQVNELRWSDDNQTVYGRFGGPPLDEGWIYNGEAVRGWNIFEPTNNFVFALPENIRLPFAASQKMMIIGLGSHQVEGEILIWDMGSDEIFRQILSSDTPEQDHIVFIEPIYTFDLHPNQRFIAIGHDEGITVWDITIDQPQDVIMNNSITKLNFTLEGNRIVSMTSDDDLVIWQIEID